MFSAESEHLGLVLAHEAKDPVTWARKASGRNLHQASARLNQAREHAQGEINPEFVRRLLSVHGILKRGISENQVKLHLESTFLVLPLRHKSG